MGIIDDYRAAWGAAPNANPRRVAPATRLGISWHYDGGSALGLAGKAHAACLARVKADQAFHQSSRGWADIGYNVLVCQHGRTIEGRGVDLQGAHSPGVNAEHYGVQFMVGGAEAPTPAAYARARRLAAELAAHSRRNLRQWGHRDDPQASTECPGPGIESWVRGQPISSTNPTTGGLTVSDINTLTDQLADVLSAVQGLRSEEGKRYTVATGRYQHLVRLIAADEGQPLDSQAIADAIPDTIAQDVVAALVARLQTGATA